MRKATFTATLLIALAAPISQVQAVCELSDLRGRWDVYGMGEFFEFGSTFDCVFRVSARGRVAQSICINRGGAERLRTVHRGELDIRRTCVLTGEIVAVGGTTCLFDGTMTKSKDMISGVADCDTGLVQLFSMVRR